MESAIAMILHAVIIGIVLYLIMFYALRQTQVKAETRSAFLAALALVYMLLFGHKLPTSLNRNLF
jgi:uncharacterized membrane-anchored protein